MTGPTGRVTTLVVSNERVQRIEEPSGRITTFAYNANNLLTSITAPDLTVTSFLYDASNYLSGAVLPDGGRYTYTFDDAVGTRTIQAPGGQRTTYLSYGGPSPPAYATTAVLDANGNRTSFGWLSGSPNYFVTDPLGRMTTLTGMMKNIVDRLETPSGAVIGLQHKQMPTRKVYRLEAVQVPSGARLTYVYDSNERVSAIIEEDGNRSTLVWDSSGNRIALVNARQPANQLQLQQPWADDQPH